MSPLKTPALRPERPPMLPGFESLQRFWEPDAARWTVKILPGEYYVTRHDEAITTILGSCVSACIRDREAQVGGMNHFMLPEDGSGRAGRVDAFDTVETRYGSFAMEKLINDLLKLGAVRERLEVKIFGGAKILQSLTDIGAHNIAFIKAYLGVEALPVAAHDLGGEQPRKVVYYPASGKVRMKRLRPVDNRSIADREQRYLASLRRQQDGGEIELFT